ncbi:TetR/AcrR family transcriptional regulator [Actinomadura sp. WMMB 499]|uniref:TetR/AcrR family transcriptional regulator n=1 Tax=Actinomadura sp. WMMB 499 TaxID=1219491 RepID=UPI00124573BC|nr:TetR/AcrR family transcriptional regulator [Actinomadura sp. WMMB 499]QFG22258.1 TetR/AcrR family transcriptional regulator [Actinomadura sp. WMMB 499]
MSDSPRARDSGTRAALIDAATRLMLDEGYAAVTTRKVAAKAGANPALVYYHFGTMDDLFLAVFRRGAEASLERLEAAARAGDPLRALWQVSSEPQHSALTVEFIALANHRQAIRAELADYTRRYRRRQQEIIERVRAARGTAAPGGPSPAATAVLAAALARILSMDGMLGITEGHAEVLALIEDHLANAAGR